VGAPDFPRRPLAGKFLYRALVRVNAYKCAKFQLPSSTSFRDNEGVLKINVGATTPCRTPYAEISVCAQCTWQDQTACQIAASCLCIMQLCEYVFPISLPLPKKLVFGGFEGEDVKIV